VRFVQIQHGAGGAGAWDAHGGLKNNHSSNCAKVDQPIAGLIQDLKRRGLLDETLIVFASEFGRTPGTQGSDGRDHHIYGFSVMMAGGGIKGGTVHGTTDEIGFHARAAAEMDDRVHADDRAIEDALPWLAKATELAPKNATYLTLFGITSMQTAGKTRSVSAATRGRDAVIRAIELEPDNLDAREALLQFYVSAPWPIGSRTKAKEQAEAIAQRNPTRGLFARVQLKTTEKKYDEAIVLCEISLEQNPDFYPALAELGRLTVASGTKLERGLAALRRCLQLEPTLGQATHSLIHYRIGTLHLKLSDKTAARAAFTAALQLDPKLKRAADALAKLDS
jgi:tetratricopeptide (TPR) repeat protein